MLDWGGAANGAPAMAARALDATEASLSAYGAMAAASPAGHLPTPYLPARLGTVTHADATLYVGGWAFVGHPEDHTTRNVAIGLLLVVVVVAIVVLVVASKGRVGGVGLHGGGGGGGGGHFAGGGVHGGGGGGGVHAGTTHISVGHTAVSNQSNGRTGGGAGFGHVHGVGPGGGGGHADFSIDGRSREDRDAQRVSVLALRTGRVIEHGPPGVVDDGADLAYVADDTFDAFGRVATLIPVRPNYAANGQTSGPSELYLEMTLVDNLTGLAIWHAEQTFPAAANSREDVIRAARTMLATLPR
jgi:hypothetical protein